MKRLISKVCLVLLWIIAIFLGVLTALYGTNVVDNFSPLSSLGDMFRLYDQALRDGWLTWFYNALGGNDFTLAGIVFACAVIVLVLLVSLIPTVILCKKKKMKGEKAGELKADKDSSETGFVDAKGNFGHVLVKGDIPSPLTQYSGNLSDKQLDMEFDWHNYVSHAPVVRIILAVLLIAAAVLFLLARFGSYDFTGNPLTPILTSIEGNINLVFRANEALDTIQRAMFGPFIDNNLNFGGFFARDLLDLIFWFLASWIAVFTVLLLATFVAWIFKKPGAVRRAKKARKKYLEAIAGGEFDGKFLPSAAFAVGVTTQPDREEQSIKDIEGLGTGIVEIQPIEGRYEGNVVNDSLADVSLSTFHSDVLILGKPLFQSIADVKEDESKPVYDGIQYYADGQGHILPIEPEKAEVIEEASEEEKEDLIHVKEEVDEAVEEIKKEEVIEHKGALVPVHNEQTGEKVPPSLSDHYATVIYEPRPSDRQPEYWYSNAQGKTYHPVTEETYDWGEQVWDHNGQINEKLADQSSENWEERSQVEEQPVLAPVYDEEGVYEDELDRRILIALEPYHLKPPVEDVEEAEKTEKAEEVLEGEKEIRPSDREPEYWYENSAPVHEEEEIKEIRPSDREPAYWYGEAYDGKGYAQENDFDRRVLNALAPESLEPIEKGEEPVEPVVTPAVEEGKVYEHDFDRRVLNALNPDVLKPVDANESETLIEPSSAPSIEGEPKESEPLIEEGEETPVEETFVWPSDRPSDKEPDYWYDKSEAEQPTQVEGSAVSEIPAEEGKAYENDFDRRILNALNPENINAIVEEPEEAKTTIDASQAPIIEAPVEENIPHEEETTVEGSPVSEIPAEEGKAYENGFDRRILNALNPEVLKPVDEQEEESLGFVEGSPVSEVAGGNEAYENDYDRRIVNALNPENLEPVEIPEEESATEVDVSKAPIIEAPVEESIPHAEGEEEPVYVGGVPVSEIPEQEGRAYENGFDRRILNALNPDPESLISLGEEEELEGPEEEVPTSVEGTLVSEIPGGDRAYENEYDRRILNALDPENLEPVEIPEEEKNVAPVEPSSATGVEGESLGEGEAPVIWPSDRPSNEQPEHWYDKSQQEAPVEWPSDRPSDKEPDYWFDKNEIKKRPAVKPIETTFVPKDKPTGPKPTLIEPIRPVAEETPVEERVEEEKPVGPVTLASHKIHEAPKIKINPVEARLVKFQLKKVQGNYKGELTPEEAFANALTNQVILVNPIIQGQGSEAGSKYLANKANKEKNKMRRTGYAAAVSVNPVSDQKDESKPVFNKPVSEFKSIREWSQAKKKFEEEQKALAAQQQNENKPEAPVLPKKPIDVVKPVEKEEKPVEEEAKPDVKKVAPIRPIVPPKGGFNKPKGPIKPIKPIDPTKKGE